MINKKVCSNYITETFTFNKLLLYAFNNLKNEIISGLLNFEGIY